MPVGNFKRFRRPRYYKKSKKMPKVSKAIRSYVDRAMSVKKQNRQIIIPSANNALSTAIAGSAPTAVINLLPQPSRNVNDDGRIGNALTIKRGIIKGYVNLRPYNSVSNPIVAPLYVKMWVVSSKITNSGTLADTNIATNFFDGNTTPNGFQNNILDLTLPNNRESWVVHYTKIIKLGLGSGTNTYLSTQVSVNDNSSFTGSFQFNWGRKCRSVLKYQDSVATPTNRNMWLIMTAVSADGEGTTITGAEYHYTNITTFEC